MAILALTMGGLSVARTMTLSGLLSETQLALERVKSDLNDSSRTLDGVQATLQERPNLVDLVAHARLSVFTVRSGGALGTAFVIESNRGRATLLTNYHVISDRWIKDDKRVAIKRSGLRYTGTVRQVSAAEDLALIQVREDLPALPRANRIPEVGTDVVVVGSPVGIARTVSSGIVSGAHKGALMVTAPISPGSSGSPVLDLQGRVVGVINGKLVGQGIEGMAFAVKVTKICEVFTLCDEEL